MKTALGRPVRRFAGVLLLSLLAAAVGMRASSHAGRGTEWRRRS